MDKKEILVDWNKISLIVGNNYNNENPTIFLHWWWQNKYSFQRTLDFYENNNISYISIDLPWFGESTKPDDSWWLNEYAKCIEQITKLFNIKYINIVAHWLWWEIAIYAAWNNIMKIDKLVLIASWWKEPQFIKLKNILIKITKNILVKIGLQSFVKNTKNSITTSTYTKSKAMDKILHNIQNYNINPLLTKIYTPTLIIWWTKDKQNNISNGIFMNEKLPNSYLFKIEWWDHFPHVQHATAVTKKLTQFIYDWK